MRSVVRSFLHFSVLVMVGVMLMPQGAVALTFTPQAINVEVVPGIPTIEELVLLNESGEPTSVVLEPTEVQLIDTSKGQASFLLDTVGSESIAWVSVEPSQFVLGPGDQRTVRVTLLAPEASSGSLTAGIAANFRPVRSDDTGNVAIMAVTGPFIFANVLTDSSTVEGHIVSFEAAGASSWFSSLPVPLSASFANSGTTHLVPKGTMRVRDVLGRQIAQYVINAEGKIVLPQTTREFEAIWDTKMPEERSSDPISEFVKPHIGPFGIELEMQYGESDIQTAATTIWLFPWRIALLLALVLCAFYLAYRRLRRV